MCVYVSPSNIWTKIFIELHANLSLLEVISLSHFLIYYHVIFSCRLFNNAISTEIMKPQATINNEKVAMPTSEVQAIPASLNVGYRKALHAYF
jgi:hypothetical protein